MNFEEMKYKDNNQPNDLISVIIPVYNVQDYLSRCLESVVHNSYRNLEIICIDDGSTDGSLEILKDYEKKDARIRVFSKKNGGVSSARNLGLKKCTGRLVAFIDSDDRIHKDYFGILLKLQQIADYDVVVCSYIHDLNVDVSKGDMGDQYRNFESKILNRTEYMYKHITKDYVWGKLYKRECLDGITFDEELRIEDTWFNMQFAAHNPNMKACYINIPLYGYYVRKNSLVSYINCFSILKLAEQCFKCAQEEMDVQMREIFLLECLKRGLNARYDFALRRDKVNVKICYELLKNSVGKIENNKMKYSVLVYCPLAYRLFRIITDPTMLKYEKKVREEIGKSW